MTRCETTHPDGRRCLLPVHPGKHLLAAPGAPTAELLTRVAEAWGYPRVLRRTLITHWIAAGESVETLIEGCSVLVPAIQQARRRVALPSISAVVGEA